MVTPRQNADKLRDMRTEELAESHTLAVLRKLRRRIHAYCEDKLTSDAAAVAVSYVRNWIDAAIKAEEEGGGK